jgi:hypothetical protein
VDCSADWAEQSLRRPQRPRYSPALGRPRNRLRKREASRCFPTSRRRNQQRIMHNKRAASVNRPFSVRPRHSSSSSPNSRRSNRAAPRYPRQTEAPVGQPTSITCSSGAGSAMLARMAPATSMSCRRCSWALGTLHGRCATWAMEALRRIRARTAPKTALRKLTWKVI